MPPASVLDREDYDNLKVGSTILRIVPPIKKSPNAITMIRIMITTSFGKAIFVPAPQKTFDSVFV